jgi:hypothetical protein
MTGVSFVDEADLEATRKRLKREGYEIISIKRLPPASAK